MEIEETFSKDSFLASVRHSMALSNGLPDYCRGCQLQLYKGFLYLFVDELSLLELRDALRNGQKYGKIISIVDSMSCRFHWALEPNYDEILSWPHPNGLAVVQDAFSHWYHTVGSGLYAFSHRDPWKRKVHVKTVATTIFSRFLWCNFTEFTIHSAVVSRYLALIWTTVRLFASSTRLRQTVFPAVPNLLSCRRFRAVSVH